MVTMRKLLIYLKDYKKESILGPLFKLLEASFELMVPLVMAAVIDTGIASHNQGYIVKMCLVMIGLGIVGLISSITAQYFAAKAAVGFSTQLRSALFRHIQSFSYSELDEIGTSTLVARMTNDVNLVQNGVNMVLRLFLRSPFIVFGAMIMAFTIDVKSAMIFVVTIPVLTVIVLGIMLISIPLYKKVQERLDRVLGITRENLKGVRVVRAFHKEEDEIQTFNSENGILTRLQMFVGRISGLMNPLTYVIINISIVVLLNQGSVQVNDGVISQGALIALINYMSQILVELVKFANLIITVTKAIACGNRIQSVLEKESSMEFCDNTLRKAKDGGVEFDHVSLTYANAQAESLSDIHFTVKKGETVGIIGGTGSGKTSLVHLIPRFYDATSGSVRIDGVDVKEYSKSDLRERIGIVMQKAVLFRGTIADNLRWGNESATKEQMWDALDLAMAKEFVEKKDEGLNFVVEQEGKNLSGGQKQRLTIARAIMKQPEILILDDSSSALDYATDAALRQSIRNLDYQPTVFIVSQRTSSIQHANKIIVLDDGVMVGFGTHEELLRGCEVYQEIYYSQFPKEEQ